MPGVIATGASFTFIGFTARVAAITIETPRAQIVDMTGFSDDASSNVLVPSREWSGGAVTVEYIAELGASDPQQVVRRCGPLLFVSNTYSVSRQAILESASTEIRVGESVRGSLRFVLTDYYGT